MRYMQHLLLGYAAVALAFALPWPPVPRLLVGAMAALLLLLAAIAAKAGRPHRRAAPVAALATGAAMALLWSGAVHQRALAPAINPAASGGAVTLLLQIAEPPRLIDLGNDRPPALRIQARVMASPDQFAHSLAGADVRLTWYSPPPGVAPGQRWRVQAMLKRPWGFANPAGFDAERWLLGAALRATGWIRSGELVAPAGHGWLERQRGALAEALARRPLRNGPVLLTLLVGRAESIDDSLWQVLRATGTVHLLVVSGLHISLAAGLGWFAAAWLCRLAPPLLLWCDARRAGCIGATAAAAAYAALAGGGLSVLRATIMAGAGLLLLAGSRTRSVTSTLLLVLVILLLIDPLAVHRSGLWLSFAAVAALLATRVLGRSRYRAPLGAQFGLSVAGLPLLGLLTGQLPWAGLPANLIAVPVVSLVVVPLTLIGGGWCLAGGNPALPWGLADVAVSGVLNWLGWLAGAPAALPAGGTAGLLIAQGALLWWWLRPAPPALSVIVLCAALPLVPRASGLRHGEYRLLALDVGQGSAILVETRRHRLLYDAGPAYPGGFDTGAAVVVPTLVATGGARLDRLILSHDDLDHTGGADRVRADLQPAEVIEGRMGADRGCDGRSWRWDGVRFAALRIPRPAAAADNDRSCVLVVDDGRHATLLAGDIGAAVEAGLVRRLAADGLRPHLMFAPHHGSRSSSSRALVRVARPRLVFVSAGHDNRFGHPHPQVVGRYRDIGARVYGTADGGALLWHSRHPDRVVRWRAERAPYWRAQPRG